MTELKTTALHGLHLELGAKMVPFAGYDMPVQYPMGVMKEHLHTRAASGLFDVSHMGQVILQAKSGVLADAALALETLVPVSILALKENRQRYAMFTNDQGGILDDLMVANRGDHLFLVVNAACKAQDVAHLNAHLSDTCDIIEITDRSLLALQGPRAEAALANLIPSVADIVFMDVITAHSKFGELWISRSGYSGEDGFEISVPDDHAQALANALLSLDAVEPVGLGARDSLRLEAGLCLYGSDLDTTTSPVEASLTWAIQKARRTGGDRAGGFLGADRILKELDLGPKRTRIGLRPQTRAPIRAGTQLYATEDATDPIGSITSGAFGPTIKAPMSMGYVDTLHATIGKTLYGDVRGKRMPATVSDIPFHPSSYKR